jgi:predicted aspartyl protease
MTSKLEIKDNLPFVKMKVKYKDKEKLLNNVLIDTGSASSILKGELVKEIGIKPEPEDPLGSVRGIGGSEFVYIKEVDLLSIGDLKVKNFKIDIGDMDYGFDIDAIIGMDFLQKTGALIDLHNYCISKNKIER